MILFKKHLSRRTVLKGVGASVGLPLLDAMIPAGVALAKTAAAPKPRMAFIYFPHGAVMDKWTPKTEGADFDLPPILQPLAPFQKHLTIISGLENKSARRRSGARDYARHVAELRASADQPRSVRRRHAGPDRRAAHRAGHAAAFARNRDGRAGWRRLLRPQLRLQLRQDDFVPRSVYAAADGAQPAQAVPAALRAGRHRRGAQGAGRRRTRACIDIVRGDAADLERTLGPRDRAVLDDYLATRARDRATHRRSWPGGICRR